MPSSALHRGVVLRRLVAAGALAALVTLLPACTQESTPTPAPSKAAPVSQAQPAAPAPAAKPAEAAPAAAAKPAATPADKAAASAKNALSGSAGAAGAAAAHDAHDGHDHGDTQVGQAPAPDLKSPEQLKLDAQAQMEAKMAGMKPGADPLMDTDPNSKARITYEFGSDLVNFGRVMQGDVLNHKFELSSSGEEDLVIKQAKPTCGCTVAQIMVQDDEGQLVPYQYGKPITPGRKIEIGATLHTQNKRGHAGSKINVTTNDPRGQTILSLEADVEPFFSVNPPSINFANLTQKDTATDKLSVATSKGQRVKLTAVADNMPQGLKVELRPLDEDADGKASRWEMVATAGPGLVEGNLAYSVALRSDEPIPGGEKMPNGQMPTYEVSATVMARVTGAISFLPQYVSLGLIRPSQALSRTIRITSHDPEFKLTSPEVSIQGRDTPEWEFAPSFSAIVRPVPNENAVDVEVTLSGLPETVSGSFSGMLVVKIGHPDKPEIKIPITGVCRGSGATPISNQPR